MISDDEEAVDDPVGEPSLIIVDIVRSLECLHALEPRIHGANADGDEVSIRTLESLVDAVDYE